MSQLYARSTTYCSAATATAAQQQQQQQEKAEMTDPTNNGMQSVHRDMMDCRTTEGRMRAPDEHELTNRRVGSNRCTLDQSSRTLHRTTHTHTPESQHRQCDAHVDNTESRRADKRIIGTPYTPRDTAPQKLDPVVVGRDGSGPDRTGLGRVEAGRSGRKYRTQCGNRAHI